MAQVNDIVLIHLEESPVSFARIESILPDAKKDWYQIKLLMLQIPLQVVTWILKDDYINGEEFFMNGKQMKLKKVECPNEELLSSDPAPRPRQEDKDTPAEDQKETARKEDAQTKETQTEDAPPKDTQTEDKGKIISFSDLKKKDPR